MDWLVTIGGLFVLAGVWVVCAIGEIIELLVDWALLPFVWLFTRVATRLLRRSQPHSQGSQG